MVFVNRYFRPDQSATSQLLTDLATALSGAGMNIHVICSRQRYDDPAVRLPPWEILEGVTVHRVWTTRFGRGRLAGRALDYLTFYGSGLWVMWRLVRRGDTLVAETDPPLISLPALTVARLRGADLINWLQDIFPEVASALGANPLPRFLDRALRGWRNASLHAARMNVVLGERMRERLLSLGVTDDRIRIVPNWAEVSPALPKPATTSGLRTRFDLGGRFVVGYSGNLGRAHEYETLLGAADRLRGDPDILFLMIGGGAGVSALKRAVTERDLPNFRFLPYQPREALGDCLAAADVHWVSLLPALEGLIVPSKYYGILAAGRPVLFIGDPEGELARDIRASGSGAAVGVGDSERLACLLSEWKADPAVREFMGLRAYERYRACYEAQHAFTHWRQILRG